MNLDKLPDEFFERPNDFCKRILDSTLSNDYDMSSVAAEKIDFLLNRYIVDSKKSETERLRADLSSAPRILKNAALAFQHATTAASALLKNSYTASAVFAALPAHFGKPPEHIDELIEQLDQLITATADLSKLIDRAEEQNQYSDGLPQFKRGAQSDPSLDVLVRGITNATREIILDGIEKQEGQRPDRNAADAATLTARVTPYVTEFLQLVNVNLSEKSVKNRITEASR